LEASYAHDEERFGGSTAAGGVAAHDSGVKVQAAEFLLGAERWEDLPAGRAPEVAFLGRSNVGKSSLINMAVGRRSLAGTSREPGKTRQIDFYKVNGRFLLVDLPGLGYAKVSRSRRATWTRLIERYLVERQALRLAVHLIDSRHPPTSIDEQVMDFMVRSRARYAVALTKVDKLSKAEAERSLETTIAALQQRGIEATVILTSAAKGIGRQELSQLLQEAWERHAGA
jgi:GTP-binding protein